MDETEIADVWMMFKEYLDKKQIAVAAERYVDLLADHGVEDEELKYLLGTDAVLDHAINYYLDLDDCDTDEEDE